MEIGETLFSGNELHGFRDTIDSIIDNADKVFKEQISSLIAEKVHLFDDLEPICENTYASRKHGADQSA